MLFLEMAGHIEMLNSCISSCAYIYAIGVYLLMFFYACAHIVAPATMNFDHLTICRSLKLGIIPSPPVASLCSSQALMYSMRNSSDTSGFSWNDKKSRQGKETSVLTRSCLAPLIGDGGTAG